MFCYKCGKSLKEGAKFCRYCGCRLEDVTSQNSLMEIKEDAETPISFIDVKISEVNREEVLTTLENARSVIYEAYSYVEEADKVQKEAKKKLYTYTKGKVPGIKLKLFFILGGIIFCNVILSTFFSFLHALFIEHNFSVLIAEIPLLLLTASCFFYAFVPGKIVDDANKETDRLIKEGEQVLANNFEKIAFLDKEYWNPEGIDYLIRILSTGRAETWKEALALGETHMHQYRMENKQEIMMGQMNEIAQEASNAAQSAEIAAMASVVSFFR